MGLWQRGAALVKEEDYRVKEQEKKTKTKELFETNQQDYGIDAIGLHSLNRIVCLWYCASDDSHLRKPGFLPNSYILWELSVEHVNPGKEGWEEGKVEEEREWRSEPSRAGHDNKQELRIPADLKASGTSYTP